MNHLSLPASVIALLTLATAVGEAEAGVRPISRISPQVSPGDAAAGDSGVGTFSADGKFVFFLSSAPNLVTNDHNGVLLDVFRRELATGKITLASVRADGHESGNGQTTDFSVSADGRFVAFSSYASDLVAGDGNGASDIFLRDLQLGETRLVSATGLDRPGLLDSSSPILSADGKFVLFESSAPDLVPGDTNLATDVFLRDLAGNTTVLVSARPDGAAATGPSSALLLSDDGEVIVFRSTATDLVPAVTGQNTTDLYVRRRSTGVTTRIVLPGVPASPSKLPVLTYNHTLSANGRYLAFRTDVVLVAKPQDFEGVWWFDLDQGTKVRASGTFGVGGAGDDSTGPVMAADGRTLAFETRTATLAPGVTKVWNADTGLHSLDELALDLPPDLREPTNSVSPVLSPDGAFLAFQTDIAVPAAGVPFAGESRLYVRRLATGDTRTLFSTEFTANFSLSYPAFSPDSQSLLLQVFGDLPGIKDGNQANDLFLAPVGLESVTLLTPHATELAAVTGSGLSLVDARSVSDDGRFTVFASFADDLVTNDHNRLSDVFLYDAQSGTNQLISVGSDDQSPAAFSNSPRITGNGRYVVFVSSATNLADGDVNLVADVYVRDLVTGSTVLASAVDNGTTSSAGIKPAGNPVISADGRYVAFESAATDLVNGPSGAGSNVFLRDLQENRTYWLSNGALSPGGSFANKSSTPTISADGLTVAFLGGVNLADVYIYSHGTQSLTRATTGGRIYAGELSLSANGERTAFLSVPTTGPNGAYWRDNVAGTNQLILGGSITNSFADVTISADGRRVAFASNKATDDTDGLNDVVVFDISTGVLSRVSTPSGGGNANGASDSPAFSGNGRFLAFRSFANNLVAGDTNQTADIYVRDLDTGDLALVSRRPDNQLAGNGGSSRPVLSADGHTVVFRSSADDLTPGDFNFVGDVFIATVGGAVAVDSDGDGLPDALELQLFGGLGESGTGDFDGDGVSNYDEFVAGTDLKNAQSYLHLEVSISAQQGVVLRWQTVTGVSYQVRQRSALVAGSWNAATLTVVGDGSVAEVKSPTSVAGSAFYQLVVQPR